ncbi:hypothetical protein HGRIS_000745 [Hohenbuehelia grisea]|uniref:Lysine-specific metallo-endopeptidase domain-containing protein n=1 Tax=Hohenbuehelia grisea TaxID=104357 RepID=A0ABR3IPL5_9AGAR
MSFKEPGGALAYSVSHQTKLNILIPTSTTIITLSYLQKHGENPADPSKLKTYTDWFGKYNKDNYSTVYNHFRAKASDFDLTGSGSKPTSLSYRLTDLQESLDPTTKEPRTSWVFAEAPGYQVNLGPKFMTEKLEKRVHAIVHETMHFQYASDPSRTKFLRGANGGPGHKAEHYGKKKVQALAKSDPHYAIDNADSLARFAAAANGESCASKSKSTVIAALKSILP